jgi:hypothetical protein
VLTLQEIMLLLLPTCAVKHLSYPVAQCKILYETGANIYGNCPALNRHGDRSPLRQSCFRQLPFKQLITINGFVNGCSYVKRSMVWRISYAPHYLSDQTDGKYSLSRKSDITKLQIAGVTELWWVSNSGLLELEFLTWQPFVMAGFCDGGPLWQNIAVCQGCDRWDRSVLLGKVRATVQNKISET